MLLLIFETLLSVGVISFVWKGVRALRSWAVVPHTSPPPEAEAPLVTALVPARDEERSIERCVRSLLEQDYPRERLRVVAVDDRSSDATPRILASLAVENPRLAVLQGSPLPNGWQGKCWALYQAARAADPRSAYLLFVDADTVHHPSTVSSSVAFAGEHGLDLLSVVPGQDLGSAAERVLLPTVFGVIGNANGTLAEVNDPSRPRTAKAIGQFLFFRAAAYWAIGGHESVKDEIVEDFALARRTKGTGLQIALADGRHLVRTRMYRSVGEIWGGFSKNAFDETRRQPGGVLAGLVALPALAVAPWLLTLVGLRRVLRGGSLLDYLALGQAVVQAGSVLLLAGVSARLFGLSLWYGLAQPVSSLFLWAILVHSTWRNLSGRGVVWKGRTY